MCSRNTTLYFLLGIIILLVAVLGLVYMGVNAKKPLNPVVQVNLDPNFSDRQGQVNDHPSRYSMEQIAECNEPESRSANSLYEEGQEFVEKDCFNEAFTKISAALDINPSEIRYRKSLIVLQKLSSAEFMLRQIEARWNGQVSIHPLEDILAEAQQIVQRTNDIEIESYPVPVAFWEARTRLLDRASNLVNKLSLVVNERPLRQKFDDAWRQLDWSDLEELVAHVSGQAETKLSTDFRKLVQTTGEVLRRYKAYLSAKSNSSFMEMAALLTEMLNCLPDHNAQDDKVIPTIDRFSELRCWSKREWDSLLPQAKSRFQMLCDDATSLLEKYAKAPITNDEINDWGTATDYESVTERAKLLSTVYSKLRAAIALAEAAPQAKLDCHLSLQKVESEIHRLCAEAYKKAYILENVYGDLDTAEGVYKIVATLPNFENNDYAANARTQLQKFHISQTQKHSE
jgi:hypothetical protein